MGRFCWNSCWTHVFLHRGCFPKSEWWFQTACYSSNIVSVFQRDFTEIEHIWLIFIWFLSFHLRKRLFDPPPEEVPQPADRPGGFNWGEPLAANQDDAQQGFGDAQ